MNSFEKAVERLNKRIESKMRLELEPSIKLLNLLDHPDRHFRSIVVAGTNGKGSTCAYLTSIAREAGLNVGTLTSPHLRCVTERVAINGLPISQEQFAHEAEALEKLLEASRFGEVTYYEFISALALKFFAKSRVDLAVVEVGLGGRLDTANAITREAVVFTPISYDHMNVLGSTLTEIAAEKGALICKGALCITAPQLPEAQKKLEEISSSLGVLPISIDQNLKLLQSRILGDHQRENARTAATTAIALRARGFDFTDQAIREGIQNAQIPGRIERFKVSNKEIWLDIAHNTAAAKALVEYIQKEKLQTDHLVIGMLKDKDWKEVLTILTPPFQNITLCKPTSDRSWNLEEVQAYLAKSKKNLEVISEPVQALTSAIKTSNCVVCMGSTYTVGPIRSHLTRREAKR